MSIRAYRLTLVACVLSWFLVGLHLPGVHAMTHHGQPLPWPVLALVAALAAVALWALWRLLRAPAAAAA